MSFSVKKEHGILIFTDFGGPGMRNEGTIWCIKEADKVYNWNDFKEIKIFTEDFEINENDYTYSKMYNYKNLVPDFNFYGWPEVGIHDYNQIISNINICGKNPYFINKVGWIGNINTHSNRKKLIEIGNENKELFDFFEMDWLSSENILLNSTKYIPIPQLVNMYSILIDIEGRGYSGRLKYLLWSHRPLLIVDRPHKEYFFEYLKEWEHFIPVKRDLSDLIDKTLWCLNNYNEALIIAENAYQISKIYLTRDACYKQWNHIISKNIISEKENL